MSFPTPATLAELHKRKQAEISVSPDTSVSTDRSRQSHNGTKTEPSTSSSTSDSSSKSRGVKPTKAKPFRRTEHLTQKPLADNPDLKKLQEEFKEMEDINKKAGWYDRNRDGKGKLPKGTKPNPAKANTINKENN